METESPHIASLRDTVQVRLADGRVFEGRRNEPLGRFLGAAHPDRNDPIIAAVVGDTLRELAWPVPTDIDAMPVYVSDSDGMRIYSRTLSFLLVVAVHEMHPGSRVFIDYSVPDGGYYCRVEGHRPFTPRELGKIADHMRKIVAADRPIERCRMTLDEALELFAARGEPEKAALLRDHNEDHIHLYELNGFREHAYGYMAPSTGILRTFALETFGDGFILRIPRREAPTVIQPLRRFTGLRDVFVEYGRWLQLLGIPHVGALNEAVRDGRIRPLILVAEALHEKRIAEIARMVVDAHRKKSRVVLIAGPSSSGKTTFAKRLAVQILASGLHPFLLGMDDYFHPRYELARIQGDALDFDALSALDVELLLDHVERLLRGDKVALPRYDFRTGLRSTRPLGRVDPDQIILAEGIHGLNPELVERFNPRPFCIFVSALTQLNLDSHSRVPTTDTRLLRRVVRDARERGYDAETTLGMWDDVRDGEKRNIFPFQEQADVMFNSALAYELAVLRPLAEPLLLQVRSRLQRIEAERLLAFLKWFEGCSAEGIPANSILREFIGGSTFEDASWVIRPAARAESAGEDEGSERGHE